jgi:hypothetical protein
MAIKIAIANSVAEDGNASLDLAKVGDQIPDKFLEGWNFQQKDFYTTIGQAFYISNLIEVFLKPLQYFAQSFGQESTVTFLDLDSDVEEYQVVFRVNQRLFDHLYKGAISGQEYFENPDNISYNYFKARKFAFCKEPEIVNSKQTFRLGLLVWAIEKERKDDLEYVAGVFNVDAIKHLKVVSSLSRYASLGSIYHLRIRYAELDFREIRPASISDNEIGFRFGGTEISMSISDLLDPSRFDATEVVDASQLKNDRNFFLGAAARQIGLIYQSYSIEMLYHWQEVIDLDKARWKSAEEHWQMHLPILDPQFTREELLERENTCANNN